MCYVLGRVPNGKFGSTAGLGSTSSLGAKSPVMSKLESIASSAVRAADKVHASLIIVYTHTGETACCCCWSAFRAKGQHRCDCLRRLPFVAVGLPFELKGNTREFAYDACLLLSSVCQRTTASANLQVPFSLGKLKPAGFYADRDICSMPLLESSVQAPLLPMCLPNSQRAAAEINRPSVNAACDWHVCLR